MASEDKTTGCVLPPDRPAICPACGATEADSGCRAARPNDPVLALLRENERLRADLAEAIALATVWLGKLKPEWNELVARVQGNRQ